MKVKVKSFKIHSFKESCFLEKVIVFSAILFILTIFSLCFHSVKSKAAESVDYKKAYVSVEIKSGDTLTDIAREFYSPSYYHSLQDAIDEVKELNNLHGDHITEGCYLVVPMFVD